MEQQTSSSSSSIPWRPAFVQALKQELEQYKDALEFTDEYQLNAEPLEIDMVIVKKAPELVIEKNIARIFKRVNILEYKALKTIFRFTTSTRYSATPTCTRRLTRPVRRI